MFMIYNRLSWRVDSPDRIDSRRVARHMYCHFVMCPKVHNVSCPANALCALMTKGFHYVKTVFNFAWGIPA
jgi:hypothetical protein